MRIILSILLLSVCYGNIINVPAYYSTIQAGINGAEEGDTVLVAAGTYVENIVWPATNGIKLIGSGENDCSIDGDSLTSVIRFEEDLGGIIDSTTLITGFTIQNGWAEYGGGMRLFESNPTLTNLTFSGNTAGSGGGMILYGSRPTLTNVTFSGNTAGSGGGMWLSGSRPTLTNVTFSNNTAKIWDSHGGGGGMYLSGSRPTLTGVIFSNNTTTCFGGGMSLYGSSPTLTDVTFSYNTANDAGGGMALYGSSPTLTDVTFSANTTEKYGGGMSLINSSTTLTSVIFNGNSAGKEGGGMDLSYSSNPTLTDVTFSYNTANDAGGGMALYGSSPTLTNSILWGNSPLEINFFPIGDSSSITITYSDIEGGEAGIVTNDNGTVNWGDGNIDADPLFCDVESGYFTLAENSPLIGAGENGANIGALGVSCEEPTPLGINDNFNPKTYTLFSYPNPFNPTTAISFSIPEFGLTTITAYDITGRELETLTNKVLSIGNYSINWNASSYPGGVYLIRMDSGEFTQTQKVVLVK